MPLKPLHETLATSTNTHETQVMNSGRLRTASLSFLFSIGLLQHSAADWREFRGSPGAAEQLSDLPLQWSETEGIRWRLPLAGVGQSSPVILGNTAYITSTSGENKETLHIQAIDLQAGLQIWHYETKTSNTVDKVTDMISQGAPSPVVSESGIIAFFESGDLIALDPAGQLRWQRDLVAENAAFVGGHGVGSSLFWTPYGAGLLIDHDGPSYLMLIDKESGKDLWRVEREARVSWTTPRFADTAAGGQIIVSSNGELRGYAARTGTSLWSLEGLDGNTVASPTIAAGKLIIGSSKPSQCLAMHFPPTAPVTDDDILWKAVGVTSSFGSPLVTADRAYFVNRAGALQAVDLESGESLWKRKLPSSTWASALAGEDRLYFFCKDGETVVFPQELEEKTEPLAVNELEVEEKDRIYAVAADNGLFLLRKGAEVICVGESVQ